MLLANKGASITSVPAAPFF